MIACPKWKLQLFILEDGNTDFKEEIIAVSKLIIISCDEKLRLRSWRETLTQFKNVEKVVDFLWGKNAKMTGATKPSTSACMVYNWAMFLGSYKKSRPFTKLCLQEKKAFGDIYTSLATQASWINGFRIKGMKPTKQTVFLHAKDCLKNSKTTRFLIEWWPAMRNGSTTIIFAVAIGPSKESQPNRSQDRL